MWEGLTVICETKRNETVICKTVICETVTTLVMLHHTLSRVPRIPLKALCCNRFAKYHFANYHFVSFRFVSQITVSLWEANLTSLNLWWTFFIVLLKWICRLYLFLHHDSVKSFSKVTVLPGPAVDSRKIMFHILTKHAKGAAFWSHEVSLEATTCWRWFHQIKLLSSHACSLKLVSSDSELDKSLSKYSSTFPPGIFWVGMCCPGLQIGTPF